MVLWETETLPINPFGFILQPFLQRNCTISQQQRHSSTAPFFPIYTDQGNGFTTQCVILDSKPAQEVTVMHMETDGFMSKTLTPRVHKMEDALKWSGQ